MGCVHRCPIADEGGAFGHTHSSKRRQLAPSISPSAAFRFALLPTRFSNVGRSQATGSKAIDSDFVIAVFVTPIERPLLHQGRRCRRARCRDRSTVGAITKSHPTTPHHLPSGSGSFIASPLAPRKLDLVRRPRPTPSPSESIDDEIDS